MSNPGTQSHVRDSKRSARCFTRVRGGRGHFIVHCVCGYQEDVYGAFPDAVKAGARHRSKPRLWLPGAP